MTKEQIILGMIEVTNNITRRMSADQNMDLVVVEQHIESQRDNMAYYYSAIYDWLLEKQLINNN